LQLNNIRDDSLIDLSDNFYISDEDYTKWISRLETREGDCVITNVGRVGAVAQIPPGLSAALGRNMTAIRCKEDFQFPAYLITCLTSDVMREEINTKIDTGTILDALNVKNIPLLKFTLAPKPVLSAFEKIVRPLRKKMEINLDNSQTLATIRDALLPKLLSGELRVKG
jgi:type I restriction enzyme S subunit